MGRFNAIKFLYKDYPTILERDRMKPEERKKSWDDLPEPKPDWETFKRMLPVFNFNALAVHRSWTAKQQQKMCNNHHQKI